VGRSCSILLFAARFGVLMSTGIKKRRKPFYLHSSKIWWISFGRLHFVSDHRAPAPDIALVFLHLSAQGVIMDKARIN
jgi:hypothetical protein